VRVWINVKNRVRYTASFKGAGNREKGSDKKRGIEII